MDNAQNNIQSSVPLSGEKRGLSGSTIKIIAVIAMLIDHAAASVLARYLVAGIRSAADSQGAWVWQQEHASLYLAYNAMRAIGRLGFPIFCFLLVEGFQRTRNVKKYALRLGIFALISEIPFDFAICGQAFNFEYQNVYFTLLLGLLALCAFSFFEKAENQKEKKLPAALRMIFPVTGVVLPAVYLSKSNVLVFFEIEERVIFSVISGSVIALGFLLYGIRKGLGRIQTVSADITALALCMTAAELLRTDYVGMGVLTMAAMYLLRRHRAAAMAAGCVVLCILSPSELPAFFAVIPVALYNGSRGLKMKYFFYAFYPAHLALLYIIAVLAGLGGVMLL